MKKLLLHLTLWSSVFASAQGIDNPTFVHNFSGGINQGITGAPGTYSLSTNVILTSDKFGNSISAIDINGPITLQQLAGAASGMTGDFTVGFWYKRATSIASSGTINHRPFFTVRNTSPGSYGEGTHISISNDEASFVFGHVSNSPNEAFREQLTITSTGVNIFQWNYYSLVKDGTVMRFYINGVHRKTLTGVTNYSAINTGNIISLGGYSSSGNSGYCAGSFDNLRVYNRALEGTDVTTLFNHENGDQLRNTVKAKYDFNEGNIAHDTYGNFHGVAVNNPQLGTDRHGNPNSALRVTASDIQGIKIPYLNDYILQKGTIAFWLKPEDANSLPLESFIHLPNEKRSSTNVLMNNNILMGRDNGTLFVNSTTGINEYENFSMGSSFTNWQHVAITFDNTTVKTYLNGLLYSTVNTIQGNALRRNGGGQYITLGHIKYYEFELGYTGLMDEVIIDSQVYNAIQIQALAATTDTEVNVSNAKYVANFSGHLNAGAKGTSSLITVSNSIALAEDRNGNADYAVRSTAVSDLVRLNGAATSLAENVSDYTIGFWYKRDQSIGKSGNINHRPFFSIPNASNIGWGEGLYMSLNNAENQFVYGYIFSNGAGSGTSNSNTTNIPENITITGWNYYTIVKSGNLLSFYVNDILLGTKTVSQFGPINTGKTILLGGFNNGSNNGFSPGYYDNLRVYNYAFSNQNRMDLLTYELNEGYRPNIKAKYEFNANSIGTDSFGNFNAVAVNNPQLDTDRHGNPNSALKVSTDQNSNGIRIPYLNEYFGKNNGSIAFWFKGDYTANNPISSFVPIVYLPNHGTLTSKNALAVGYRNVGGVNTFITSNTMSNNQLASAVKNNATVGDWQHCVVTFDNSLMKMYLNGVAVATANIDPFPTRIHGGGQDITVGFVNYEGENTQFNGLIDDLLFDNVTYTNAQVEAMYEPLSVNENQLSKVTLFPNPATNVLNFSTEVNNVIVYDMSGRTIMNANNTTVVNISELASGNYIVKYEVNGVSQTTKFIKK